MYADNLRLKSIFAFNNNLPRLNVSFVFTSNFYNEFANCIQNKV